MTIPILQPNVYFNGVPSLSYISMSSFTYSSPNKNDIYIDLINENSCYKRSIVKLGSFFISAFQTSIFYKVNFIDFSATFSIISLVNNGLIINLFLS